MLHRRFAKISILRFWSDSRHFYYALFVVLALNVNAGYGCMPGYEAERTKLRQYLGIEWSPNALAKMDAEKVKPIRHANELNCDFERPDTCRWQNVRDNLGGSLDTLDYYLFRKEDNTDFPVIQVRPGPSKVAVGEQMLFTGDRRKDEQSALLVSWPIRCQNNTGKLTFTFWIYNGASVEVLILVEDPKTRQLRVSPEKQHVDCGTVTVNTECTVEVPPHETPFRIGIRAFDLKNTDGAFVMIDNIFYEAQLCKVSIDFGSDFRTEKLMTAEEGDLVEASSQLSCHDFGPQCRWRNGGPSERSVWRRGLTSPPNSVLFNETGTYTKPSAPFAFMYIEEELSDSGPTIPTASVGPALHTVGVDTPKKGEKLLISDPILCQSPTNPAIISFRLWATRGMQMSICALDLKMKPLDCQKISLARSPAPVYHKFDVTQKFTYAFRVDEVNSDFDNFVILDDIEYRATMCEEAQNTLDLGVDFYTTPMLSTVLHKHVHSDSDLACDFSRRAVDCHWANLDDETMSYYGVNSVNNEQSGSETGSTFLAPSGSAQFANAKWEIGLGRIDEVKFASLTNRQITPESDLAVARLSFRGASAVLVSEMIRCLDATSTLSLRYWRTGETSLSVCVLSGYSFEAIDCQLVSHRADENHSAQESDRIFIDIPRFSDPVRIALRAEAQNSAGVVAIDDILFKGHFCPNTVHSANSRLGAASAIRSNRMYANRASGAPTKSQSNKFLIARKKISDNYHHDHENREPNYSVAHSAPDENVCRLLSCDFDTTAMQMCLYTSSMIASSAGMFTNFNHSAHAMLFERARVAVIESTKFSLNAPARLHFDFVIKKGVAHLHVCQDSVRRELDTCYNVESAKTAIGRSGLVVHDFVELLPTDTKVYIIAKLDSRSRKASVKIDNIELTDVENHKIC